MNLKEVSLFASRIRPDFRSRTPIYLQLVERIRQLTLSGDLSPGEQLPTVRALAQELRINFNTVARAYRLLDEAGIISTQQGRGTYILEIPPPEKTQSLREEALASLLSRCVDEASRLGYEKSEILEALRPYLEDES